MWNDVEDEIVSGLNWLYKYVRLIRLVFKSFYHYRVAKRSAVTLCVNISLSHVSYKTGTNKRRRQCRRIVAMVPWYLRQNTRFFLKSQTSELQCIYPLYRKESVILFSLKAICMVRFTYIYCITKPFLPIKRIQDLVTDGNIDN